MSRMHLFNSPLLLGFEEIERSLDRVAKMSTEGYPPYNIEQIGEDRLRITLAVAGFDESDLSIQRDGEQLLVSGKQDNGGDDDRMFLHRGIAARQFQRSFVLAEGIEVTEAHMQNGLLHIDLHRPKPKSEIRTIAIRSGTSSGEKSLDVESE